MVGFFFGLFPICSHDILKGFLKCSPKMFPISPGPKGEAHDLSMEFSILGNLHSFNLFFVAMGQSNWLIAKIESLTCEAPPTN